MCEETASIDELYSAICEENFTKHVAFVHDNPLLEIRKRYSSLLYVNHEAKTIDMWLVTSHTTTVLGNVAALVEFISILELKKNISLAYFCVEQYVMDENPIVMSMALTDKNHRDFWVRVAMDALCFNKHVYIYNRLRETLEHFSGNGSPTMLGNYIDTLFDNSLGNISFDNISFDNPCKYDNLRIVISNDPITKLDS